MRRSNIDQMEEGLTKKELKCLLDRYSNDLFFFVHGIVKNNEIAEELVSDVFVKLWNKKESYSSISNIKSYLYILARNESITYIRKNSKLEILSIEDIDDFYSMPLESDGSEEFNQEVIDQLNTAIESLPKKCKMAFSLAKINGLKYKEIAEIMEILPKTVKNHVAYAFEKIITHMGLKKANDAVISKNVLMLFLLRNKASKSKN